MCAHVLERTAVHHGHPRGGKVDCSRYFETMHPYLKLGTCGGVGGGHALQLHTAGMQRHALLHVHLHASMNIGTQLLPTYMQLLFLCFLYASANCNDHRHAIAIHYTQVYFPGTNELDHYHRQAQLDALLGMCVLMAALIVREFMPERALGGEEGARLASIRRCSLEK